MRISGQCLCGLVRYQGEVEPGFQITCYCVDCRKTSAAGHAAMMAVPESSIELQGETKGYTSKTDSGNDATRAFCPTCGAGIFARNSAMPGMIFLKASTLDDPNLFSPQMAVYASRAPDWDPAPTHIPAFSKNPPSPR